MLGLAGTHLGFPNHPQQIGFVQCEIDIDRIDLIDLGERRKFPGPDQVAGIAQTPIDAPRKRSHYLGVTQVQARATSAVRLTSALS